MTSQSDHRTRMAAVMVVFVVIAVAAGLRMGYWQVVRAQELSDEYRAAVANAAARGPSVIRADIVDRKGTVLARTSFYDQLVAYPDHLDPSADEAVTEVLTGLLAEGQARQDLYMRKIEAARDNGRAWVSLEAELSPEQSDSVQGAIDRGEVSGIGLESRESRHYPMDGGEPGTTIASNILGFVGADGHGGEGLEAYYDKRLETVDPDQVDLATLAGTPVGLQTLEPAPLQLTIDADLQQQLESDLLTAQAADRAKSASAIVMDPETGAILAAATVPGYDAEDYANIFDTDPKRLRDRIFSDTYEPGSVMKIFTVAAALDRDLVKPSTIIKDRVQMKFFDVTIHNADHKAHRTSSVKEMIAYSRNLVAAKLARMLAPNDSQKAGERLYEMWKRVGLTGSMGVDVANEAPGTWCDPATCHWYPLELANRSFGQGVAVTLPQLARGYATFINGGFLIQPHLTVDGEAATVEPKRVVKAKTAREVKDIMSYVTGAVPWYAEGALIPGYEVGGKTGTAQIWNTRTGDWKERRFNHTFVGFIGGRKQEYVIAVRIQEAKTDIRAQGNIDLEVQSYQLYQSIARSTIKKLGMRRSNDPLAGRPIPGTAAWRSAVWNHETLDRLRQEAQRTKPKAVTTAAGASSTSPEPARSGSSATGSKATKSGKAKASRAGSSTKVTLDPAPAAKSRGADT
jgi:cell division protein FtsI (penicillin-binding protein 3)